MKPGASFPFLHHLMAVVGLGEVGAVEKT